VLALICFITSLVGFNVEREFNCNVHPPSRSETSGVCLPITLYRPGFALYS
jgi:hypothetical protein